MLGQKAAVIAEVLSALPGFKLGDNALTYLTPSQLETIKNNIVNAINNGGIEYSKDPTDRNEVKKYGRSMVMNHLKKAKELNGGVTTILSVPGSNGPRNTVSVKPKKYPKGINIDLLPEELQEYVKSSL